jgi:hypothetical protein
MSKTAEEYSQVKKILGWAGKTEYVGEPRWMIQRNGLGEKA